MSTRLQTIRNLIASSQGRFFTATFVKKNGETRVMNARIGVKSHSAGGTPSTAAHEQYMTVFDAQIKAYRTLNLETISKLKINGVTFEVK
jgi:hypothetical protein